MNLDHFEQPEQDVEDEAVKDAKAPNPAVSITSTRQNVLKEEEMTTSINQTGDPKPTAGISKDTSMMNLDLPCKGKIFPKKRVLPEDFLDEQDGKSATS